MQKSLRCKDSRLGFGILILFGISLVIPKFRITRLSALQDPEKDTLDRLGYGVEWQCLNSKDFGVPQSRNRVYIVGYLDERCRGKVFPFTETTGGSLIQTHGGHQGERVYSPEGLSCTLAANPGGFGGKTGLYEVGVPIQCATKTWRTHAYTYHKRPSRCSVRGAHPPPDTARMSAAAGLGR